MKILFGRMALVGLLLLPLRICALDVAYGSFFTVRGVTLKNNRPVLPITRGQYANVRILDKKTFDWLADCKEPICKQEASGGQIEVTAIRAAKARSGMWIADISVDSRWLLTFLVFQNPQKYGIVVPDVIRIEDTGWHRQVEKQISEAVDRLKQEDGNDL